LFRALSDQLYDTTERHDEIRQTVVWYLRSNREQFEPFVPLDIDDLVRSQPSTRSSRSRGLRVDDAYEAYLENMAKPKTWGGEVEIRAFSEAYDKDVLIHRPTNAGQPFDQMVNNKRAPGQPRQFLHVSFGVSILHFTLKITQQSQH
jgi:OTU-like cysteine protease